jgi:hypothetical protein
MAFERADRLAAAQVPEPQRLVLPLLKSAQLQADRNQPAEVLSSKRILTLTQFIF